MVEHSLVHVMDAHGNHAIKVDGILHTPTYARWASFWWSVS